MTFGHFMYMVGFLGYAWNRVPDHIIVMDFLPMFGITIASNLLFFVIDLIFFAYVHRMLKKKHGKIPSSMGDGITFYSFDRGIDIYLKHEE